jgi:hypothetical protein
MQQPDVRLDVRADAVLEDDRREAAREDVGAVRRKAIPVHSSHSAGVPRIVIDSGAGAKISPPTSSWTRIHGSKCVPSGRRHSTYVSIGMRG